MPIFQFAVRDGGRFYAHPQKIECSSRSAAESYACQVARELMVNGKPGRRHWKIEIHDGGGTLLCDILFATADPTLDGFEWRLRDLIVRRAETLAAAKALEFRSRLIVSHNDPHSAFGRQNGIWE